MKTKKIKKVMISILWGITYFFFLEWPSKKEGLIKEYGEVFKN